MAGLKSCGYNSGTSRSARSLDLPAIAMNHLEHRVRQRLAEWEAAGLLRVLRPPAGVDFSSNDYLNLSTHPLIVDRFARAVEREGCGSTGSRLLRGDRDVLRGDRAAVRRLQARRTRRCIFRAAISPTSP